MKLSRKIMYQAILDKDTSFEGIFFTAVKTTGIFCRPSCTARKPKSDNVEFFSTSKECLHRGYRPCKVCKPLHHLNEMPIEMNALIEELEANPGRRLKDGDLLERGLEPHTVRRWFLKNHGITFHAYQRMFRINTAFKKIQQGDGITGAAFDAGFESLSGFGESFKNIFGVAPKNSKAKRVIDLKRVETRLGTMIVCAVTEGICLLEFSDRKMLETELIALARHFNATIVQGSNPHFELLEREIADYFDGKLQDFTIPLSFPGSAFQKSVWKHLMSIPYGTTATYGEQAAKLGRPEAVRAVGRTNGMNRISIIIPCHRVVAKDGALTGYGGGIWRKKFLLDLEKSNK
ncbi:MAG: bifunctional transcriptional activator/DNA repair enzyme AdaA [Imperialibacter sp.]|uniref:bifunctional transcriptional activator/DNA repair enzyme AdaA n=1 Tax=Imperialibacter sp. TaxID=2038411 RepID=UPI003A89E5D7